MPGNILNIGTLPGGETQPSVDGQASPAVQAPTPAQKLGLNLTLPPASASPNAGKEGEPGAPADNLMEGGADAAAMDSNARIMMGLEKPGTPQPGATTPTGEPMTDIDKYAPWAPAPHVQQAWYDNSDKEHGLPPGLASAIAFRESSYDPSKVNKSSGAQGLMQFMPNTVKEWAAQGTKFNPMDGQTAADVGGKQLAQNARIFGGDWEKAVAAYNSSPLTVHTAVVKAEKEGGDWKAYIPRATRTYLAAIKSTIKLPTGK